MYKDMKKFLKEELKREAEQALQDVQNDPELRDLKAPDEIRERLFATLDEREAKEQPRVLTEEDEKLIEIGKLYIRRQKRRKYLVVALVAILTFAFGITAMGGPKKIVEDIRRMMMGRTQMGVDVDSKNFEPIEMVDEEAGYQMIKDKWGVEPARMQYYLEDTHFDEFNFNEILHLAQFTYKEEDEVKLSYQVSLNYGTISNGIDMEEAIRQSYQITIQDKMINIKEYDIENKDNSRWVIDFSHQNVYYMIWIEDETQSNMEKIVKNLTFY